MRARALTLLHAAMSEVWEGRAVPADGGVRARNQQRSYVDRVAGRNAPPPAAPPLPTARPAAVPPRRNPWVTATGRTTAWPA
jgi:RNA polymerase sigma factor for flagellar operon FliA